MTTPQRAQTRMVLSEIRDRPELHRLGTTQNNNRRTLDNIADGTGVFIPTTLLDNTTNVALAQDYIRSPMPSPDELVIRQRGRRSLTKWSPERAAAAQSNRSPFQRTPTKKLLTSNMILRSSPRKRLTLGSTPPEPILNTASPTKSNAKQQLWPDRSIVKKPRLHSPDERPIVQLNTSASLDVLLQSLSKQQLIDIIVTRVASDVKAEEKLRSQLPTADIEPMERELLHAKRNIYKSLPTSRLCKKTDSIAYSRAALYLAEFKRTLSAHTKVLYDTEHWDALFDYVCMAWPCVRATPNWDSATHNVVRRQCFKLLTCHCIAAIQQCGPRLGISRLQSLEKNLRDWSRDYEEVLSCVNVLNKTLGKGRTSI